MIFGDLHHSERYNSIHPDFERAFETIKNTDWFSLDLGKKIIDGDRLFIINAEVDTLPKEKQSLEYHKKYLDIHVVLKGEENIAWKNLSDCTQEKEPFNEKDDYGLFSDKPTSYVTLGAGQFAIVFPEDAHGPIIGEGKIRKLIVKILLEV